MGSIAKADRIAREDLTLAEVELVSKESDGQVSRISGDMLARLLAFAHAWAANWNATLEDGAEEVPDELKGLASLIHHAEETPSQIEPDVLHAIHQTMEVMAARLVASQEDAAALANRYTVAIRRKAG